MLLWMKSVSLKIHLLFDSKKELLTNIPNIKNSESNADRENCGYI